MTPEEIQAEREDEWRKEDKEFYGKDSTKMIYCIEKLIIVEQKVEIEADSKDEATQIAQEQEPEISGKMYYYDNFQPNNWKVSVK